MWENVIDKWGCISRTSTFDSEYGKMYAHDALRKHFHTIQFNLLNHCTVSINYRKQRLIVEHTRRYHIWIARNGIPRFNEKREHIFGNYLNGLGTFVRTRWAYIVLHLWHVQCSCSMVRMWIHADSFDGNKTQETPDCMQLLARRVLMCIGARCSVHSSRKREEIENEWKYCSMYSARSNNLSRKTSYHSKPNTFGPMPMKSLRRLVRSLGAHCIESRLSRVDVVTFDHVTHSSSFLPCILHKRSHASTRCMRCLLSTGTYYVCMRCLRACVCVCDTLIRCRKCVITYERWSLENLRCLCRTNTLQRSVGFQHLDGEERITASAPLKTTITNEGKKNSGENTP